MVKEGETSEEAKTVYVVIMNVLAIGLLALQRTAVLRGGILSVQASRGSPVMGPQQLTATN